MSALMPVDVANQLRSSIAEYLSTTFALADRRTQEALTKFVSAPATGMFHGPYVRTRMPFAPSAHDTSDVLDWLPEWFTPYGHQARAFQRLSSKPSAVSGQPWRRPEPTLVVTGTGSGKTEGFLYPILDHCRRARQHGVSGTKAILLYPMNALANDQAERLTALLTGDSRLAAVTAGIYTGEVAGTSRTKVSAEGLITDRSTIRDTPPDILLTNYKMLDQLLLRADDASIWQQSAEALQYVVLDEFHTYDGAQGTDVALLLRRLGLTIARHNADTPATHLELTDADRARPLGRITPVATSATLGDEGDTKAIRDFARTVFGEEFEPDSVVTESRLSPTEWAGQDGTPIDEVALARAVETLPAQLHEQLSAEDPAAAAYVLVCETIFDTPAGDLDAVLAAVRQHHLVQRIFRFSAAAIGLDELAGAVLPSQHSRNPQGTTVLIAAVLSALGYLRAAVTARDAWQGRQIPSLEAHLWVRELSRINRAVTDTITFSWHDDGTATSGGAVAETAVNDPGFAAQQLPAIYCRHCGRAGWMTAYQPGTTTPVLAPQSVRQLAVNDPSTVRALISADQEVLAAKETGQPLSQIRSGDGATALRWFDASAENFADADTIDLDDDRNPDVVPVLMHTGQDAKERSEKQSCPACGSDDSIRFIGSAVSTLLSVALSNMFGTRGLDEADKKSLVFADSVQDASHRAGFVEARSHAFALRTHTLAAIGTGMSTLRELAERIRDDATSPVDRFHLLHPTLADRPRFRPFWDPQAGADARRTASRFVRERLEFDMCLEFGLRSTVGRTLSLTGSAVSYVDVSSEVLRSAAHAVWNSEVVERELDAADIDAAALEAWARTVVERIRQRGGIHHPWIKDYIAHDGNTFHLTKRHQKAKGVPGFPVGGWPKFPRVGTTLKASRYLDGTDAVTHRLSWYSQWTAKQLHTTRDTAFRLVAALLARLASAGVLTETPTESGGRIYSIDMERILVVAEGAPAELRCTVCHNAVPAAATVRQILNGTPCLMPDCGGHHEVVPIADNYYRQLYRAHGSRAVVAREHTSLLDTTTRTELEKQFKASAQTPGAPNVLVATPTLEMGIDIGDLSAVMLSSLPNSVASYVQRVGRAGRLTGNALTVALVQGRGHTLPVVQEPLSLINGSVQPPAAFMSAAEILRRQFLAYFVGRLVGDGVQPAGRRARDIFTARVENYVDVLRAHAPALVPQLLPEFLGVLRGQLSRTAEDGLRAWALGTDDAKHTLDTTLQLAAQRWQHEHEELNHRYQAVEAALPGLRELAERPGASDQEAEKLQSAESAKKSLLAQLRKLTGEFWVGAMERFGLLPSYRLLDDSVDLIASISAQDPETFEWDTSSRTFSRGLSAALTELAPGNTFYAERMRIRIDSVDLGAQGHGVEKWRVCPACCHVETDSGDTPATACPACGASAWADSAQLIDVVPMRKVSAEVKRDSASVDERDEERHRRRYTVATTMSYEPYDVASEWHVNGTGFGARYLRSADIRWINLGSGSGATHTIGGTGHTGPLFRVCSYCGHLDSEVGVNKHSDHRPWCIHASSEDEHNRDIALGRQLRTEGVVLSLPTKISTYDSLTIPSLTAALKLGFRTVLGGNPDHLDIVPINVNQAGAVAPALLLHDTVPGGTGYLADFASPNRVWELLWAAWEVVRDCPCADQGRMACPRCLLPYAAGQVDRTSREVAESTLYKLLRGTQSFEQEEQPDFGDWTIAPGPSPTGPESALEVVFRERLQELLKDVGATVKEVPAGLYSSLQIKMPESKDTWTLAAQVNFPSAQVRPDFTLESNNPNRPRFVIFTDGYRYHAAPGNNNVVKDAEQRNALRDLGWIPWAVTDADIKASTRAPSAAGWFHPKAALRSTQSLGVSSSLVNAAAGDAVRLLVRILLQPEVADWSRVADVAVVSAFATAAEARRNQKTLVPAVDLAFDGAPTKPRAMRIAMTIDASAGAVAEPGFRTDWQWWLGLSNVLSLRAGGVFIGAVDGTAGGAAGAGAAAVPAASSGAGLADTGGSGSVAGVGADAQEASSSISAQWQEILAGAEELAPEDEQFAKEAALLRQMAEEGLPEPEVGAEMGGIPIVARWANAQVAVVLSEPGDNVVDAIGNEWTVIDGNDGNALVAIRGALAAAE